MIDNNDPEDAHFDAGAVGMNIGGDYFTWELKVTKFMAKGRNVL
ncbi:hypothetical protein A2U01_0084114, partial [Trifolium medium]|nr:hypothetical protein [Trifolium medium]